MRRERYNQQHPFWGWPSSFPSSILLSVPSCLAPERPMTTWAFSIAWFEHVAAPLHALPPPRRPSGPGRGRGGSKGTRLHRRRLMIQAVPQDAARQRARMVAVFQQHLTIDDGVVDALGEFPDP